MAQLWAGVDTGKSHHHCGVVDHDGQRLLSCRVANHEQALLALLALLATVSELAEGEQVSWATDQADGGAGLLIGLLLAADQQLLSVSGQALNRAAGGYRGQGKTDPGTRRSSLTRPGCGVICRRCGPAMRFRWR